jgi:SagB-type dehydrogenase family enzyme
VNDPEVAREYHRVTMHDPNGLRPHDPRLVRDYRSMQWERKPPHFKTYPGLDRTLLPDDISLPPGEGLSVSRLSRLLFLSGGVVRTADLAGETLYFRAAGSAGNLSPIEVYVVTGDVPGLEAGVYHYEPVEHALVRLRAAPPQAPPALILTGVPWRTAWKYRERGFRHLYWDAGTMLAHTLALAEEAALAARVELGFVDESVAALVGADGVHEVALAVVALAGSSALPNPEEVPAGHLADDPLEFPLVTLAQRAGDLATDEEVEGWRRAAENLGGEHAPSQAPSLHRPLDEVIRGRGSCRQFDPGITAPNELLSGAMAWATRPVQGDFVAAGATLLEHCVTVHAVEGVEPGAYRWRSGELEQLRAGDVRGSASHLCLDQALGGNGAYTAFHCARLEDVLGALGSRGYRAGQLEAGIVEGRLHLFAYDRGLGATGLTFYDREVARFFASEADPMLVTAVGTPAHAPTPGGLPRRPLRLRRS